MVRTVRVRVCAQFARFAVCALSCDSVRLVVAARRSNNEQTMKKDRCNRILLEKLDMCPLNKMFPYKLDAVCTMLLIKFIGDC